MNQHCSPASPPREGQIQSTVFQESLGRGTGVSSAPIFRSREKSAGVLNHPVANSMGISQANNCSEGCRTSGATHPGMALHGSGPPEDVFLASRGKTTFFQQPLLHVLYPVLPGSSSPPHRLFVHPVPEFVEGWCERLWLCLQPLLGKEPYRWGQ